MRSLLYTEWLKMRKYNAFWWIMGLTALSYPGINYIFYSAFEQMTTQPDQVSLYAKMALGYPFSFPEVWHSVAFFSSLFVFIPAVVVIMFVTNEFSFRTHRQNIIDGWSRDQFIASKLLDVTIITLLITALCFLVTLLIGILNKDGSGDIWGQSYYIGLFALQTFAQLSVAFLCGFLIRKAFLALGIFLFYFIVLENIIVGWLTYQKSPAAHYFPLELSDRLIPKPGFWYLSNPSGYQEDIDAIPLHILLTVLLTAIIWMICFRINRKRDLK